MDKDDIDHALHGIRMMVQVAIDAVLTMEKSKTEPGFFRLLEPDSQTLRFSLFDVLKRVDELKAEQSATTAPDAGSDGEEPSAITSREKAYFDMDGFLCNVVHMIQLADDMALDFEVPEDREGWDRLSFALHHSRLMVEAFRRCYEKRDFGNEATVVGV